MFFPEKIVSIKSSDRVLEVGPGGNPYYRSDVLLEKKFDEGDAREQRGHAQELNTDKQIVYYDGEKFPFNDNEFDYVVCSHVLEHISSDEIEEFVLELERVARKGYFEFPTIYYDYIYNFPKHLTFLLYKNHTINYLGKEKTELKLFLSVQNFFYQSADAGHTCLSRSLKNYFFQGFEWKDKIKLIKVDSIDDVIFDKSITDNIIKAKNQDVSCKQKIKNEIIKRFKKIKKFFMLYILQDKFLRAYKKWVDNDGDNTLRLDYELNKESIVFDIGGYEGNFSTDIVEKYQCYIYIFEPVASYYEAIKKKFEDNKKIKVFNFGFSDKDELVDINLNADGSSIFIRAEQQETIILKDIVSFLEKENIHKIDLMKLNIEGGEFQVLPALIKSNWIKKITNVQVQFHDFIGNTVDKRKNIRDLLKKTHVLTYDYWFVWENWKRSN